jgi:sugar lactone lactonase YvrE
VKAAALSLLLLSGCGEAPTEVFLHIITSDLNVPNDVYAVRFSVREKISESQIETRFNSNLLILCGPKQTQNCYPSEITARLVPGPQRPDDTVVVVVDAFQKNAAPGGEDLKVMSDAATFTFLRHASARLDFILRPICLGTDCASLGLACDVDGQCAPRGLTGLPPPDAGLADLAGPALDGALDQGAEDLGMEDLGESDLATADLQMPDFQMPDMVPPPPLCQTVVVSTLAGNGTPSFAEGSGGLTGMARFNGPTGVAVDSQGTVYVADSSNNRIRKVLADGTTSTLAGNNNATWQDGLGSNASFKDPESVAIVNDSYLYVADTGNRRIRLVTISNGDTTTTAGTGMQGYVDGTLGPGGTTQFDYPLGVAVSGSNVYVSDYLICRIRKVVDVIPTGGTTTLTGNGTCNFADGTGTASGMAEFNGPDGLAVDASGNVYVGEQTNQRIRKIASDGSTTTLAGGSTADFKDGSGGIARFNNPSGVAVDAAGNVYVADQGNNRIRKVAPDGTTTTVAGDGTAGLMDGGGCSAQFKNPTGVAVQGKLLYVAEYGNHAIRTIQLP